MDKKRERFQQEELRAEIDLPLIPLEEEKDVEDSQRGIEILEIL
jgi:hypothetical protein